ncbi:MAG: RNA polymerase sigma factor [Marinobacter sp.]|nr:RNA polymerase sigma factor [Marinobacter sp.]
MSLIPFRKSRAKRFEDCVQPHMRSMYRFAYRLTGQQDDAEDLVQDVLAKLYPKADEVFEVEQLGPWLNRVLYRQFIDLTRKRARQADRPLSSVVEDEAAQDFVDTLITADVEPDQDLDRYKLQKAMANALASLPPDQRSLVILHDVDGWKQEDIAEVLEIAVGTVKSRLHRCRAKLRAQLGAELEPFLPGSRVDD